MMIMAQYTSWDDMPYPLEMAQYTQRDNVQSPLEMALYSRRDNLPLTSLINCPPKTPNEDGKKMAF